MKANVLLLVYAVVAAVTGLVMLFAPTYYLFVYGMTADVQSEGLLRYVGALYGGLAIMASMARHAAPSETREALVTGLAAANFLASIVMGLLLASHVGNDKVVWISLAILAAFGIAFAIVGKIGVTPGAPAQVA